MTLASATTAVNINRNITTQSVTKVSTQITTVSSGDLIKACEIPVAVSTLLSMVTMVPIKVIAMFSLFTHINKLRNKFQVDVDLSVRKY